jgi:hypothetical protein
VPARLGRMLDRRHDCHEYSIYIKPFVVRTVEDFYVSLGTGHYLSLSKYDRL